jgi:hypothetical protein
MDKKNKGNLLRPRAGVALYRVMIALTFVGGAVLLLLVGGILSLQTEDPLNVVLNAQAELAIFGSIGVVLVTSPFWLVPYVRGIVRRKEAIKVGVSHHVRNRAQEVLLALELLETTAADADQLKMVRAAKESCYAMIASLSDVISSDGVAIDYSLAMKQSSSNFNKKSGGG